MYSTGDHYNLGFEGYRKIIEIIHNMVENLIFWNIYNIYILTLRYLPTRGFAFTKSLSCQQFSKWLLSLPKTTKLNSGHLFKRYSTWLLCHNYAYWVCTRVNEIMFLIEEQKDISHHISSSIFDIIWYFSFYTFLDFLNSDFEIFLYISLNFHRRL